MRKTALFLLLCLSGQAQAAQIPVATLPGGGLVFKSVRVCASAGSAISSNRKPILVAALATLLRQANWLDVDEEHIIKGMLINSDTESGVCSRVFCA